MGFGYNNRIRKEGGDGHCMRNYDETRNEYDAGRGDENIEDWVKCYCTLP